MMTNYEYRYFKTPPHSYPYLGMVLLNTYQFKNTYRDFFSDFSSTTKIPQYIHVIPNREMKLS